MRSKVISVFDLDHTLIQANCSYQFGSYLYKQKQFSLYSLLHAVSCYGLHKAGLLSLQTLHERLFKALFKGRCAIKTKKMASAFVKQNIQKLLYQPAVARLKEAQASGHKTLILSSSPDFLVAPFAEALQVSQWSATPYLVTADQFSSMGQVLDGEAKRTLVKNLGQVCAYSDSYLDLPLLEEAAHPIAVNPDRRLKAIAVARGWEIL